VWGNIVFGGIIGLAVDAITGGLYKLAPEQVSAQLARGEIQMAEGGEVVSCFRSGGFGSSSLTR
jgi:hypothetical protein